MLWGGGAHLVEYSGTGVRRTALCSWRRVPPPSTTSVWHVCAAPPPAVEPGSQSGTRGGLLHKVSARGCAPPNSSYVVSRSLRRSVCGIVARHNASCIQIKTERRVCENNAAIRTAPLKLSPTVVTDACSHTCPTLDVSCVASMFKSVLLP